MSSRQGHKRSSHLAGQLTLALLAYVVSANFVLAQEPDPERLFVEAERKFNSGEWEQAAADLGRLATTFPDSPRAPQAAYLAGESLVYLREYAAARVRFEQALQTGLPDALLKKAKFRIAEAAFLAGDLANASLELEQFRKLYPSDELNAFAYLYLGQAALQNQQPAQAQEFFTNGLRDHIQGPTSAALRLGLGQALKKRGDLAGAVRHFEQLSQSDDPLAEEALLQLSAIRFQAGEYGVTWRMLRPLLQTELKTSNTARATFWAARILLAQHKPQEAAALAEEAIESQPFPDTLGLLHYAAADAWRSCGDRPAAMSHYEFVWKNQPTSDWGDAALYNHVRLAAEVYDDDLVDQLAIAFSRNYPNSGYRRTVRLMQCRALLHEKRFEEAELTSEDLLAELGDRPSPRLPAAAVKGSAAEIYTARYYLAAAWTGLRKFPEAITMLSAVDMHLLSADLSHDYIATRCDALQGSGRYVEAVQLLRKHLQHHVVDDTSSRCRSRLILALAEAGQWSEAQRELEEFRKSEPEEGAVATTALSLAEKAYFGGQVKLASEIYDRLIQAKDHAEIVTQARAGLAWVRSAGNLSTITDETVAELLQQYPNNPLAPQALMQRAQALEALNEHARAIHLYETIALHFPRTAQAPHALLAVAKLQDQQENPRETIALLSQLTEAYPSYTHTDAALYLWAWALIDLRHDVEGDEILRRLTNEFPNSRYWGTAAHRLAVRAVEANDLATARYYLDRVLTLDHEPNERIELLLLCSEVAVKNQQWEDVPRFAEQVIELQGDHAQRLRAEYCMAEAQYKQQNYAAAAKQLKRLEREARAKAEPLAPLLCLRRAQCMAALEDWETVIELDGDIARDRAQLPQPVEYDLLKANLLIHLRREEQARAFLAKITDSSENGATVNETVALAWSLIGQSWAQENQSASAAEAYLKGYQVAQSPALQAACLFQAGKCYVALQELPRAREAFAIVVEDFADTSTAVLAREQLTIASRPAELQSSSTEALRR